MAKSLAQIEAQIVKLQREKEAIEKKEVAQVVARIREAIDHYGLTAADLFGAGSTRRRSNADAAPRRSAAGSAKARRSGGKVAIKYRDSEGNAWSGRGSQPRWLVAALAEGHKLEEFLVAT